MGTRVKVFTDLFNLGHDKATAQTLSGHSQGPVVLPCSCNLCIYSATVVVIPYLSNLTLFIEEPQNTQKYLMTSDSLSTDQSYGTWD